MGVAQFLFFSNFFFCLLYKRKCHFTRLSLSKKRETFEIDHLTDELVLFCLELLDETSEIDQVKEKKTFDRNDDVVC